MSGVFNHPVPGWIVFAFRKIRIISIPELRTEMPYNEFYEPDYEDASYDFFMHKVSGKSFADFIQEDLNLTRYERVKKNSKYYAEFKIFYSLHSESEVLHEIQYNSKFDYVVIHRTENVPKIFNPVLSKFYKKSKTKEYIKIKYLPELLKFYKTIEIGNFADLEREILVR